MAELAILPSFIIIGSLLAAFDVAALAYLRRRQPEAAPASISRSRR